jgi:lipopolysaccharide biosynthesis protein
MSSSMICLFFHNYYGQHEHWIRLFSEKITVPFTLFYHITDDSPYNQEDIQFLAGRLQENISGDCLKRIVLRRSPNQGKDIGGKLVLLDAWLREGIDSTCCVFLHDKRSPHKVQNKEWQERLFKIIEPAFVEKALPLFEKASHVGIVCERDSIHNEYDYAKHSFATANRELLKELLPAYDIHTTDYRYVAGTMFWANARPLRTFFGKYPPLDIRKTLEKGNVMDDERGTYTHSWERLLSWLIFAQDFAIKGL